jgi:hypothetical protein
MNDLADLYGCLLHDPACDPIAGGRAPHDERRESRILGRRRAIHPGHGLERVVAEAGTSLRG